MIFHWSLSSNRFPQVSRTLLSILTDLKKAVVWMFSTRPLISMSSSSFTKPLVTVPKAPITIGLTVTFMFHSFFFQFPSKAEVLIFLFTFFQIYSVVSQNSRIHNSASSLFFLLIIIRSCHLAEMIWSVCISNIIFSLFLQAVWTLIYIGEER